MKDKEQPMTIKDLQMRGRRGEAKTAIYLSREINKNPSLRQDKNLPDSDKETLEKGGEIIICVGGNLIEMRNGSIRE